MQRRIDTVLYLVMRRMRLPLVLLISAYAVAVLGLTLMPGVDDQGEPWRLDFFHAFYFVSYMATTIGFGELPFPFSPAQRWWTLFSIYLTVVVWFYAIGKILALVQDPAFRLAVEELAFTRSVRALKQPFYIVAGYGETGSLLVRLLAERGLHAIVLDKEPLRIQELQLAALPLSVPALCGDASQVQVLEEAGLQRPNCRGVVALTDDDQVNLKIAITSKLLSPNLPVMCRAERADTVANMVSFGTDSVIDPFTLFGRRIALALHSPGTYLLRAWLTGGPGSALPDPLYPVRGRWVLCGYGRFGKAVRRGLQHEAMATTIIEADPDATGCRGFAIDGRGTEAETLEAAEIATATGIVAGTDNDVDNLSILITAKSLNPALFCVARQNRNDNQALFEAANIDLTMQRSHIIAEDIFALLMTPQLSIFFAESEQQDNGWANEVLSRILAITDRVPEVWSLRLNRSEAPEVCRLIEEGVTLTLDTLLRDMRDREQRLPLLPLLLLRSQPEGMRGRRKHQAQVMPAADEPLRYADELLLCAPIGVRPLFASNCSNLNTLRYVVSGESRPDGVVWHWLAARQARRQP